MQLLFDYISGRNSAQVKINMTAPVLTKVIPGAGPFCESNFTVSFYVPTQQVISFAFVTWGCKTILSTMAAVQRLHRAGDCCLLEFLNRIANLQWQQHSDPFGHAIEISESKLLFDSSSDNALGDSASKLLERYTAYVQIPG